MNNVPPGIDPDKLAALLDRERAMWTDARPRTAALRERARRTQLHGTPQHWISQFPPPVPLVVDRAVGARLYDIDGHEYADFGLAATAALWGHNHPAVVAALRDQLDRGSVTLWATEDHVTVTEELQRRFGLPYWQFTVSATDANRFALLLARVATGRERILVFNYAYHGSLEYPESTKVVEFNDLDALERAVAPGDVAAVLAEPVMTNGGAVIHPDPGFHTGLRDLTRRTGTLLVIDETQTIPAGPGGCVRELGLEPDLITMGKCVAGGIPAGVYGMSDEVAAAAELYTKDGDGGLGSTLASGPLAVRAMRAVLTEVMTDETYAHMNRLAERYEREVAAVIAQHGLPWHVGRLGGRVSYAFTPTPPRNAGQLYPRVGAAARDALWLYLANRGIVLNGMSGAALMSPMTDESDVERHGELFASVIDELTC
ncbi:aminotransferase class III-fold pyridoxal phosphate-dependent enzyme [Actinocrispum wychmicini]|uniref:Glutamate-1-semialdehyde 2,1-aminomutase n=1 Tax=Actinocrispum wychmicini TaxID=1213861 RepID=A0A4R2K492_9PSEU|nr:aminotransferase class III-fold pyridoxal phosphate-dependent enzyme [Actinocrispum wychmicini]TCO61155.1 glutamate-1-semialdehyde 2,1-aminomutase [Actinocrispum wychmicini]